MYHVLSAARLGGLLVNNVLVLSSSIPAFIPPNTSFDYHSLVMSGEFNTMTDVRSSRDVAIIPELDLAKLSSAARICCRFTAATVA